MAKKTTLNEVGEMLAHAVKHMATKDDITELRAELKADVAKVDVKIDVKIDKLDIPIHRELESIKAQLENVSGFGREIDHALERIAAIEKHLGINKNIAA
jgi:hypothetical protein